jgi:hypothetical protein
LKNLVDRDDELMERREQHDGNVRHSDLPISPETDEPPYLLLFGQRGQVLRVAMYVGGLLVLLPIGLLVSGSVFDDLKMLTDSMGWLGVVVFLTTPAVIGLTWLLGSRR